jgi:predicted PurR-regulated permease PerM
MVGTFFAVPVAIFFVTLWNEFIKRELDSVS